MKAGTTAGDGPNRIPGLTIYFWVVTVLCTSVGESLADFLDVTLGLSLGYSALTVTIVSVTVLATQLRLGRYVPAVYWLTVAVVTIAGTLLTDVLTDLVGVAPLMTGVAAATALVVTLVVWFARARTLSLDAITTRSREGCYWLGLFLAFALGTAIGDWTHNVTGWTPGEAVLLPAALIAVVFLARLAGAGSVVTFWTTYVLTGPLGANLGDYLAPPSAAAGLGLGTLGTSLLFLATIIGFVTFLSLTGRDRLETVRARAAADEAAGIGRR